MTLRVTRVAALVVAVLTALLVTVGPSAPASAEHRSGGQRSQVGLSTDGVHYQGGVARPLFDAAVRWVPGDVRRSRFWVRNQAVDPGDLTISLVAGGPNRLLESGELSIRARAGDGPWRRVSGGESLPLLAGEDFPAKAEVPVTVRVALSPEASNQTMVAATELDFRVTLTDAKASGPAAGADGPGGILPATGSIASWWVVHLGLILLLCGAFLLRRSPLDPACAAADDLGDLR